MLERRSLGSTGIRIAPLVLGGNVFGWTADRETSFALLDAFLAAGYNAIDTADVYNRFAPGLSGGESETIIGDWMKSRKVRDQVVIITKGGLEMGEGMSGLGNDYLKRACEASLRRLQTDYIDVYMAHRSDPAVPIRDTLATFGQLVASGQIRHAGCSNYSAAELAEALAVGGDGLARFQVFEPSYNLIDRDDYEGAAEDVCRRHGLGVVTYYALASGFLSGKYRNPAQVEGKKRVRMLSTYFNDRGLRVLASLDRVAARLGATPAQVALAFVMQRDTVTAPIASATDLSQLTEILGAAQLGLSRDDVAELMA